MSNAGGLTFIWQPTYRKCKLGPSWKAFDLAYIGINYHILCFILVYYELFEDRLFNVKYYARKTNATNTY